MLPILNIAIRAARQFNEYVNLTVDKREHSANDVEADVRLINHLEATFFQTLMDALKKGYPTHYVAAPGEQFSEPKEDSWHFYGFDNETHLLRKLPDTVYSFVYKRSGKIHCAVIMNPYTGAEYTATKGGGATVNGRRMRASNTSSLANAYVTTDALSHFNQRAEDHILSDLIAELCNATGDARASRCTTLDLAMVATGQLEAVVALKADVESLAAPLLMCQECGVLTGTLNGTLLENKSQSIIAANPKLFKALVQRLATYAGKI
jgi:myo-inositol-1(or 4)-monophosphatase